MFARSTALVLTALVTSTTAHAQSLIDLSNSWNASLQDNLTMRDGAYPPGYEGYRHEAYVYSPVSPPVLDVRPLHRWYSPSRGDYFTTSEPVWHGGPGQTRSPDYQWIGVEGHALANPYAGTCPMYGWFSPGRGDNWLTTQYELNGTGLTTYGTDYVRGYLSGYSIRDYFASTQPLTGPFHFGSMYYGASATGQKALNVVLFRYSDIPGGPLLLSDVSQRINGPGFPNLNDYFEAMSGGAFGWRGTDRWILGLAPVDDPDTAVAESTWFPGEDMSDVRVLFMSMQTPGGRYVGSDQLLPGVVGAISTTADARERFSMVVLNFRDGSVWNNDTVALKSSAGLYLRTAASTAVFSDGGGGPITPVGFPQNQRYTIEKVSGSSGSTIRTGDVFRLKSQLNQNYMRAVDGSTVTADAASPQAGTDFIFGKVGRSSEVLARQVMGALEASPGFAFANYDADGDGVVSTQEFHLLVVEKRNNPTLTAATWGQTRNPAGWHRPPGSTVDVNLLHASAGEDTPITLWAHEVAHTLGTGDLYGHDALRNAPLTLMGQPLSTPMLMDPWHRLRLGWATPRVFNMTDPGQVLTLAVQDGTAPGGIGTYNRQPVLLYDPARYNLNTRQGEYFILEFRNGLRTASPYDRGVADPGNQSPVGLALWQVKTDANGNLMSVAAEGGASGVDSTCNHLAAPTSSFPAYTRGNWELWTQANGVIRPRYLDGTFAPIHIRIAGGTSATTDWIDVEWSSNGSLWPRLDSAGNPSGGVNVRAGSILRVNGAFPVSSATTSVTVDVSGRVICPIVSYGPYQIDARVPLYAPRGLAVVEVLNAGSPSNRHVVNVLCAADFNESGSVTVQDIFDFLAAYFAGDARADFNNSGALTVQDIFDFLATYFAGCA